MDAALGNGGRDNVTVIVVDVLATPGARSRRLGSAPRRAVGTAQLWPPSWGLRIVPPFGGLPGSMAVPAA